MPRPEGRLQASLVLGVCKPHAQRSVCKQRTLGFLQASRSEGRLQASGCWPLRCVTLRSGCISRCRHQCSNKRAGQSVQLAGCLVVSLVPLAPRVHAAENSVKLLLLRVILVHALELISSRIEVKSPRGAGCQRRVRGVVCKPLWCWASASLRVLASSLRYPALPLHQPMQAPV